MKLLTWMHRKFRQGSGETLKEFSLGQQFFDDHHIHQKQNNGTFRHGHRDGQARKSFANLETTRMEYLQGKTSTDSESGFFEGFLAIGTLGTEKIMAEPETPTFAVSFDELAEKETEVTENELRLINDELERVLAAEAKDDGWTDSSSRNSHVSNGRISHASTITLSGQSLEIPENSICPLQEYLLGAAVELPERDKSVVLVPKKEHRTSLGELFEKHKAEEIYETKCKRVEKRQDKEGDKTSKNIMKKILKKKLPHASKSSSANATTRTSEPPSVETKLSKILHKFHKKVHPEDIMVAQRSDISLKNGVKDMISINVGHYKDEPTLPDESTTFTLRSLQKNYGPCNWSQLSSDELIDGGSDSNGSRECWIKTDADYLVLEL